MEIGVASPEKFREEVPFIQQNAIWNFHRRGFPTIKSALIKLTLTYSSLKIRTVHKIEHRRDGDIRRSSKIRVGFVRHLHFMRFTHFPRKFRHVLRIFLALSHILRDESPVGPGIEQLRWIDQGETQECSSGKQRTQYLLIDIIAAPNSILCETVWSVLPRG